jgi:hypothetical protein
MNEWKIRFHLQARERHPYCSGRPSIASPNNHHHFSGCLLDVLFLYIYFLYSFDRFAPASSSSQTASLRLLHYHIEFQPKQKVENKSN